MVKKTSKFLSPGDIVDIIAPASKCDSAIFKSAISWLESIGLIPRYSKTIIKGNGFYAASEDEQFNDIKKAILAKDSKAIWCLRGGWGSLRLIPSLAKLKKPTHEKIFIGFSDITTLHNFLNQQWNWKTFHGANLSVFARSQSSSFIKQYKDLLFGKTTSVEFTNLKHLAGPKIIEQIKAKVTGGNLCMLETGIATKAQINTSGKILFLEDTGERGYALDRMLVHLVQSKVISKKIKVIILGDFTGGTEETGKSLAKLAFKNLAAELNISIYKGMPCGHGKRNNYIPFNTQATFDGHKLSIKV
ncbi:MAG: muramoyltetrapeptide carboxypeptidase [Thermoproteota archaeon]|jgi:muramoyltetrapeptide carboxypeptidase